MKKTFLTAFILFASIATANARPVSYPGGITSMVMNNGDRNSWHVHYSPTAKYSLGLLNEYQRNEDYLLSALQGNYLVKRWNEKDSQANIYLKTGIGAAHAFSGDQDGDTNPAAFAGVAADWENRRFFTSYENRYVEAGDIDNFYTQSARVGVAPYVADYGSLHTWFMLEVDHKPNNDDKFTVTPLVRFFKGDNLVEAGVSDQGDVLFNWVYRY